MRERIESTPFKMLFILFLLCTTMGIINIKVAYGTVTETVYVDPKTTTVDLGKSFTINMSIANITYDPDVHRGVYGWQCDLSFNASILQVVSVEEGPYMKEYYNTTWAPPAINNTGGTVIAACAIEPPWPTWGLYHDGTLANVTFQTTAEGVSHLNFTKTKLNTYMPPPGPGTTSINHTVVNGSATVSPGHDVAVVSVTAPDESASNSSVPIDVTVKNEGSFTENVTVEVYYDETLIDNKTITNLVAKTQNTTTFNWSTTGVSKGTYTLNATATIDEDDDPTDNSKTTTIRIVEHDVAVIDLEAPPNAKQGSTVSINVTVANQGSYQEATLNVTVSYDGNLIGFNDTVVLDSQTNITIPFSWNTASLPLGDYNLNATATIPVDDDSTDNSKVKTMTLYLIHDVAVISLVADLEEDIYATVGDFVVFNATVRNEGDYLEKVNVTLKYGSTNIDSQNDTLAQGENKTFSFTWNTTGLAPAFYIVKATVSSNNTDTWTGDGGETFLTTRTPVDPGSEKVYVNQTLMTKPANYTIDYDTGNITFTTAPGEGADVKAIYFAREDDYPGNNYETKDIILTMHDVAIVNIVAPSTSGGKVVVYPNFNVTINITITNEGSWKETVNLTLRYDNAPLGNETFDIIKDESKTFSFTWDTTGVSYGSYNLTVNATVLTSPSNDEGIDDDPGDNTVIRPLVVTIIADISGDGVVDFDDFITFAAKYGSQKGDVVYDVRCDLAPDDVIDFDDFIIFAAKYGQSVTL